MEILFFTFLQLLMAGFTLGIGFWASRKLTGFIDELLFTMDRKQLTELLTIG